MVEEAKRKDRYLYLQIHVANERADEEQASKQRMCFFSDYALLGNELLGLMCSNPA
jgi:hypothetical protein